MAFVLAAFLTDPSSAVSTAHGKIHDLATFIAFLCGGFGVLLISLGMRDQGMSGLRKIALPIGAMSALLSIVTILIILLSPGFSEKYWGIVERIFMGSVILWILIVSSYLLVRRSRSMTRADRPPFILCGTTKPYLLFIDHRLSVHHPLKSIYDIPFRGNLYIRP